MTTYNSLQNDFKSVNPKIPLKSFGLVWADEAHHSLTLDRSIIIRKLEETAYVFGLTATDCYNTHRPSQALSDVKDVFGDKIFEIELEELIKSGQLSPVKNIIVHAPEFSNHAKKLKKNKNTDYTDAELAELINVEKFNSIICDLYFNEYDPYTNQKIFGQSALVFCAGIDHSETICALLNAQVGERWKSTSPLAACVHSKISTNKRTELVERHKKGEIPILVGDSVFAEGYDNPKDQIGFFLRPTKSLVFAKQSRGRLLRTAENKENALIFDWSYPGLNQLFFKNLVKEEAWIGIEHPTIKPIQRSTTNYLVT